MLEQLCYYDIPRLNTAVASDGNTMEFATLHLALQVNLESDCLSKLFEIMQKSILLFTVTSFLVFMLTNFYKNINFMCVLNELKIKSESVLLIFQS